MWFDGTYLISAHKGTSITTYTINANEQISPLTYAIVNSENNLAYEWFFTNFKNTFGEREDKCIVLDRHEYIIHRVEIIYLGVTHGACIFHLYNNSKSHYKVRQSWNKKLFSLKLQKPIQSKNLKGTWKNLTKLIRILDHIYWK